MLPPKDFILAGCMSFERRYRCPESGNNITSFHFPSRVHTIPKAEIYAVDYKVRSAKSDQPGVGHPFHMARVTVSGSAAFDVVGDLYDWCAACRPSDDATLFSWNNGSKWPSVVKFNTALKQVATRLGLPATNVSFHSLRIDRASALAAAGADDRDIMMLRRWKSLVFINYIRSSKLSSSRSMKLIVDPNAFTTLDVHRLSRRVA